MKRIIIFLVTLILLTVPGINALQAQVIDGIKFEEYSLSTETFQLEINISGQITSLRDIKNNIQYKAGEPGYLVGIKSGGKIHYPVILNVKQNILDFTFENGTAVSVKAINKKKYLRFEILSIISREKVDAVLWGPVKTTISETIGEFVGVTRNKDFAIGIQALNVKTTGGEMVNEEGGVFEGRGSAALARDYGSSLQAFCIDRTRPQLIKTWNQFDHTEVMASDDFNITGSAIALFGVPPEKVLELLGHIEVEEGLPHIMIDGEWVKASPKAARPYIISSFGEETVDQMIDFTEKVGFYSLYHSHPFSNWGHFDLIPSLFPNGRDGLKACVDKAKDRNILMGVHTLTTFITTNDAYVTPVPHKDLAVFAPTKLTSDINETATEILIEDPSFYDKKTVLQTVRIGNELIRFARVSDEPPFKLEECIRGAFGTRAVPHKKGDKIARMIDHGYKTFYPNIYLQNEIVDDLIELFNETGVAHLDFDGHEGAYAAGYGDAGKDYFALRLIEGVDHMVVNGTSRSSHFYWHINTYMNWGEPWYGGMKESQNEIRFNNQAVHERNYQPNMLGWFQLLGNTTIEEMEWMLARAAGWNAGYALVVHPKNLEDNPLAEEIIKLIRVWEEAKNRHIFNEEQKKLLKAGENDFSLAKISDGEFHLQYYTKDNFVHENIVLQPGQPNYSEWRFENTSAEQPLYFKLGADGTKGSIENIIIELDSYQTIEIPVQLEAGTSIIYNGSDQLLIYDEKGRMKEKLPIEFGGINLGAGNHVMSVSCEFRADSDCALKGLIKLRGKVEVIKPDQ